MKQKTWLMARKQERVQELATFVHRAVAPRLARVSPLPKRSLETIAEAVASQRK